MISTPTEIAESLVFDISGTPARARSLSETVDKGVDKAEYTPPTPTRRDSTVSSRRRRRCVLGLRS